MDSDRCIDTQRARDARPWTRWWWFGSCVTEPEITRQLTLLRDAGFGGVEIQPIHAPADPPVPPIPYLSPAWMRMLEHALREADRLGLGVDLTMGSGWPRGGPRVSPDLSARRLVVERGAGTPVARSVPTGEGVKRASPGSTGSTETTTSAAGCATTTDGPWPSCSRTPTGNGWRGATRTAWTAPYRLRVRQGVLSTRNTLRLRVLVVEANRIIDLDRRGVPWRKFFFVNRDYGTFDASPWTPFPVGLLGPVRLVTVLTQTGDTVP